MSRLDPYEPRGLDLLRRFSLRYGRKLYGAELEPSRIVAHSKPSLLGIGAIGMAHQKSTAVPQRYVSLAMLRTAQLTGCEWCLDFGSRHAQDGGVPADDLKELSYWRESPRFGDVDRLVLGYAEAMTRTPVEVTDEQFAALRAHFDERQMVQLTTAIAAENMFCRTNWALGIEGQGFAEGMYCVLPEARARAAAAGVPIATSA
jgi:4-carboxymuconolactone decarboxylase